MNDKVYLPVIGVLSVLIPLAVAFLLYVPQGGDFAVGFDIRIFPFINACINSAVTILLVAGFVFITRRQIKLHKTCMLSAFALSALFLVSYVTYHYLKSSEGGATKYGGGEPWNYVYYFILITHIVLAAVIVPLALLSIYRGLSEQFDKHRRIAKWTLPIWLYVSVTGVLVYLMISPYYT